MIVRIQGGEGQYELDQDARPILEDLDRQLYDAVQGDDAEAFAGKLSALVDYVINNGTEVPDEQVVGSDLILPPSDITLDEAKRLFTDEGYLKPVEA
ncbi:MAG TPA: hypothetical protein VFB34_04255 [Chloroflexota bacterium]|nr:hypothetical protein [Chloroflexota bacterium]